MSNVIVRGAFDNIRAKDGRFLEEAARLGELHGWLPKEGLPTRESTTLRGF